MHNLRKLFNDRAALWDQGAEYKTDHIRTMLMLSDIRPNAFILDVGCGTGMLEPYLLRFAPEHILAVDFADKMIEIAKSKIDDSRVEFLCEDIFRISPGHIAADYCFFHSVFPYFSDPERLIDHISRLINPGGRLTICHPQSKKSEPGNSLKLPVLPAQGLINLLRSHFRLDVIIDNNVMFMVSGCNLRK